MATIIQDLLKPLEAILLQLFKIVFNTRNHMATIIQDLLKPI